MTIISVYTPTHTSSEEMILSIYQDLRTILAEIPVSDKILLIGGFSARLGQDFHIWDYLRKYDFGKMNSNWLLLELCRLKKDILILLSATLSLILIHKAYTRSKHAYILQNVIT